MKNNKLIPNIENLVDISGMIKSLNDEAMQSLIDYVNTLVKDTESDDTVYYCRRCGKPIKRLNSINNSMGPICYKHYCEENKKKNKPLF